MTERATFGQCVIGYRRWRLLDGWLLRPLHRGSTWRPGVNRAACAPVGGFVFGQAITPHQAPLKDCSCGLYAMHESLDEESDPVSAIGAIAAFGDQAAMPTVIGAIAAWGNIEVHHDGFRAEYAQIVALAAPTQAPASYSLDDASRIYGVPVVPLTDLEREASIHGEPLPASVIPPEPERHRTATITIGISTTQMTRAMRNFAQLMRETERRLGATSRAAVPSRHGLDFSRLPQHRHSGPPQKVRAPRRLDPRL